MNNYWKLSNAERAALTEEEVNSFVEIELMEKGVLNVPPAVELLDIREPDVPKTMIFVVSAPNEWNGHDRLPFGFVDVASAQAFADLLTKSGAKLESGYGTGRIEYLQPFSSLAVSSVTVASHDAYLEHKAELERVASRKKANEETKAERERLEKEIASATEGLWDDWRESQHHAGKLEDVRTTFERYLKLSDGDRKIARAFLQTAYSGDAKLITEALGAEPDPEVGKTITVVRDGVVASDNQTTGPKA
jgi:hypothetical protein